MEKISVQASVQSDLQTVWEYWTHPNHITHWNFASDEWCCPKATNNVTPNDRFNWRMEAKDGSMGFDFAGTYTVVEPNSRIEYSLGDDRQVQVLFEANEAGVKVTEVFDAEDQNSADMQKAGWQAILDNFARHVAQKNQ
jgi:uncharacterized protein YndB with AHSA1/START domain